MTLAERLTAYERLMRLDKPIGILLLLWPALWGLWLAAYGVPHLDILIVFVAGTVLIRSAGCVVNDLADRDFDAHVKRTRDRPLAARLIAPWEEQAAEGCNVFNLGADVIGLGEYFRGKISEFSKLPLTQVKSVYR